MNPPPVITPTTIVLPALPTAEDVRELLVRALAHMTAPFSIDCATSFLVTGMVLRNADLSRLPFPEPVIDNAARHLVHWAQFAFKPDNPMSASMSASMLPSSFCRLRELVRAAEHTQH